QVRMLAEEEGMVSLRENALAKVVCGITTADETARVIQVESRGLQCPQCLNPVEEHFVACPYCRQSLRSGCHACGKTLKKNWTTCPYCGAASADTTAAVTLRTEAAPAATEQIEPSPQAPTIEVVGQPSE